MSSSSQTISPKTSIVVKIFIIGLLSLALLVPTGMIWWMNSERSSRNQEAISEIMKTWAGEQSLAGPVIVIPYHQLESQDTYPNNSSTPVKQWVTRTYEAYFLPQELNVNGELFPEIRYRGIFKVPVYTSRLEVKGKFKRPDFSKLGISEKEIEWDKAVIRIGVSELKGLRETLSMQWNETSLTFGPGETGDSYFPRNVESPLKNLKDSTSSDFNFSLNLSLAGSQSFNFIPLGKQTQVNLRSNWTHPSFDGAYFPVSRSINEKGFEANWSVLEEGRQFPQMFTSASNRYDLTQDSFGVKLMLPVDIYQLNTRSVKYANLFILLSFTAFFLFEILSQLRIHPLQYLLVGLALSVFYLLLLSLSEQIGFSFAYLTASTATVSLILFYLKSVLKKSSRLILMGGILSGLYAYLYALLQAEDYALLLGSIGLFAILALVMFITRKIDWYGMESDPS